MADNLYSGHLSIANTFLEAGWITVKLERQKTVYSGHLCVADTILSLEGKFWLGKTSSQQPEQKVIA